MTLTRSRNLFDTLVERIRVTPDEPGDPFLEAVVANYLLTTVYAEVELQLKETFSNYSASHIDHERVASFAKVAVGRLVRSVRSSELAGTLAFFDEACKSHYQAEIRDTPTQVAYDRVVDNRHLQAHELGSGMTLDQVGADIASCEAVIQVVGESLNCSCH